MCRRLVLAAALAVAAACSGTPTKERSEAEAALTSARAAGAHIYAPAEFKAAEGALTNYDAAVLQRDYRQALRLAIEAREGAYGAARRAGEEKAATRVRAEALITQVQTLIKTAEARLGGPAPSRPSGAAASRLRAGIKTAHSAVQKARSLVDAESYIEAITVITPVVATLQKELEAPARRGR